MNQRARQAPVSRSSRGDATRERLIEAGFGQFSEHGYGGVTTRQLSAAAHANLAAIAYHFGGKKGLYHAVLERVVDELHHLIEFDDQAPPSPGPPDRARLATAVAELVGRLLRFALVDQRMAARFGLLLREYNSPSDAFPILFEGLVGPMHKRMSAIAAAATGGHRDDPENILHAHMLIGQCMAFAYARAIVWARMGWKSYPPERVEMIVRAVTDASLASLGLPPAPAAGDAGSAP